MKIRNGCRLGWTGLALAVLLSAGCGSGGGGGAPAAAWYEDVDGDGYTTGNLQVSVTQPEGYVAETDVVDLDAVDCDDTSAAVNPAAAENCNEIDDNCDLSVDEGVTTAFYADLDADGYGDAASTTQACSAPAGYVADNTDCDDAGAAAFPGASESCNGIDDNCDGTTDEGVTLAFYADVDADGYGDAAVSLQACSAPAGYVSDAADCDDAMAAVHPGAAEICNGTDDDCDGATLDGSGEAALGNGCDGTDGDLCAEGTLACVGGAMECSDTSSGNIELCNGLDDDCDDSTADGSGEATLGNGCDGTDGDLCAEGTLACVGGAMECSDISSGNMELCNGLDDDCDDSTADGSGEAALGNACDGPDGDLCAEGTLACVGGAMECSDTSSGNMELCNGLDDDCDIATADAPARRRHGNGCDGTDGDLCAEGTLACVGGAMECSDTSSGTMELCNGLDDDCDGSTADGSGEATFGNGCDGTDGDLCAEGTLACVGGAMECSDTSSDNLELCNGADDDCDGAADNNLTAPPASNQNGVCAGAVQVCLGPPAGWTTTAASRATSRRNPLRRTRQRLRRDGRRGGDLDLLLGQRRRRLRRRQRSHPGLLCSHGVRGQCGRLRRHSTQRSTRMRPRSPETGSMRTATETWRATPMRVRTRRFPRVRSSSSTDREATSTRI